MSETFLVSLATFFATIGPLNAAVSFAALTAGQSSRHARRMALKGVVIAAGILLTFALGGEFLLKSFGISLSALRIGGGILLLLIAIEMTFARRSGGTSTTAEEDEEAEAKQDISVFPLSTPMIAGPGAMGATILLMANAEGDLLQKATIVGCLLLILLLTYVLMLLATPLKKLLGITGMHVITRIFGVLLTALAVQFMIDGLSSSGLFT